MKQFIYEDKKDAVVLKELQKQLLEKAEVISSFNDKMIFSHKGYMWEWKALKANWYIDKERNSVYGFRTKVIVKKQ